MEQENKPTDKEAISDEEINRLTTIFTETLHPCVNEVLRDLAINHTFPVRGNIMNAIRATLPEYAASLLKEKQELKEIIKQMTEDFAVKVQEITASNEAKEKECERLKGLIETAFIRSYATCYEKDTTLMERWQRFKKAHNL